MVIKANERGAKQIIANQDGSVIFGKKICDID